MEKQRKFLLEPLREFSEYGSHGSGLLGWHFSYAIDGPEDREAFQELKNLSYKVSKARMKAIVDPTEENLLELFDMQRIEINKIRKLYMDD